MKRIALAAAVLFVAACTTQEDAPAIDTTMAAPAMAPAPMDTSMIDTTIIADSADVTP